MGKQQLLEGIKFMCQKHKTQKLCTFEFRYNVYKQERNYLNSRVEIIFFPQQFVMISCLVEALRIS